ncbi:MAG: SDR family NAD(P)-dependent oxidoreductase [candidate division Zixibacteria bacterium]|nr:SDR family NAD(P)-dependent oxidoreductase [candidate division Zixibacteria bacterium]
MESIQTIRTFDRATAIVTGGASGIGRAIAEELAKRGCEVVLADLQIELAEEVASEIHGSGGKAKAVKIDVTDFFALQQLVQETVKCTGRLDYIFNNAGIVIGGNVNHYGIEDWNEIVNVNLRGVINGVQAAYKVMMAQGFGHIVNTASLAGLMPFPGNVAYATTKHGVVGLSKSLRAEATQTGVRVSVLCPGFVRTAILERGGKYGRILMDLSPEHERRILEIFEKFRPMDPNIFAKKALELVAKNKPIVVLPSWWKLFWWIHRLFPSLGIFLAQRQFQDFQEKLSMGEL